MSARRTAAELHAARPLIGSSVRGLTKPRARAVLVGEHNPYSTDPRYCLYPHPPTSAAGRLCRILGLNVRQYLARFDRYNLIAGDERWSAPLARLRAASIEAAYPDTPLILLGARVADAFDVNGPPWHCHCVQGGRPRYFLIPHPSGRSRAWNRPDATPRTRDLLAHFLA